MHVYPTYGRLSDVMGRRRVNELAILFAAVGVLAYGLSNSMQMPILSRLVSACSILRPSSLIFVARFLALEVAVYLQPLRKPLQRRFHRTHLNTLPRIITSDMYNMRVSLTSTAIGIRSTENTFSSSLEVSYKV